MARATNRSDAAEEGRGRPLRPATPLSRKLVRYIVGFGAGVGVGLAPYLGLLDMPPFVSLLTLIPGPLKDTVIPLSAAMMGTIAVVVQWYGGERLTRKRLGKMFAWTLATAAAALVLLAVVRSSVVVEVPVARGGTARFVVGFTRPQKKKPCVNEATGEEFSDAECIKHLTFNPAKIRSHWGDGRIRTASLALTFAYLLCTGSFGALVGLVVLKEGGPGRKG